jgi:hypothetical protein
MSNLPVDRWHCSDGLRWRAHHSVKKQNGKLNLKSLVKIEMPCNYVKCRANMLKVLLFKTPLLLSSS